MATKKKRKKKRRLRVGRLLLLLCIVIGIPVLLFYGISYINLDKPVQKESEEVSFTIESGETARNVISSLQEEGIIKKSSLTYLWYKANRIEDIKAGEYTLDKSWDLTEIFSVITDPSAANVDQVTVTIIEGDWAKNIASKISAVTNVNSEELLALWNDEDYIRSLMEEYPFLTEDLFNSNIRIKLEGFLCPDTYNFYPETDADTVTRRILDQQLVIYNQYLDQIRASSYSVHDLYTLASIVQYESGQVDDMKMIAGVFYNRLDINMALQSSVTVCYALDEDSGENWFACEANADYDNPYNTYMYPGLPPGPICNPGYEAIEAVLNPQSSNYYYFMADIATGEVYYAETLDEHNANIASYGTGIR